MTKQIFQSTKVYDGFSTTFRQWRAKDTHCKFLHGYGVSFKLTFEGELDEKNWVYDFGGFKRSTQSVDQTSMNPKKWLDYMFDHTTVIAEDDPALYEFETLDAMGVIQLRVLPAVGAEQFAKFIYDKLNPVIEKETDGRVHIVQVEFCENQKNSAIYKPL